LGTHDGLSTRILAASPTVPIDRLAPLGMANPRVPCYVAYLIAGMSCG
jgi:hypothetical protein